MDKMFLTLYTIQIDAVWISTALYFKYCVCVCFLCSHNPLCAYAQYDRCTTCLWHTEIICKWPSDTISCSSYGHLNRETAGILSSGVQQMITKTEKIINGGIAQNAFFCSQRIYYTSNCTVNTDMLAPRLHSCHSWEFCPAVLITCIHFSSTALARLVYSLIKSNNLWLCGCSTNWHTLIRERGSIKCQQIQD